MKYLAPVILTLMLLIPAGVVAAPAADWPAHSYKIPTFYIESVVADDEVTIVTRNFPAGDKFTVTMGLMGTRGIKGIVVTSQNSGKGGSFKATYKIPAALKGEYRIAIRLESPTSGYFAYNWFYNNTATGKPPGGGKGAGYGKIPIFFIESVVRDDEVTIKTHNFPANDEFKVTMGKMGTRGIGGIVVDTQDSGDGGSFTATYKIPNKLKGDYRIAIRLESATSGYFAYNWFYNNTTGGTKPPGSGKGGMKPGTIPTFSIKAVVRDDTVTILTNNFPANDNFKVTMNYMGTRGIGGWEVATQPSNDGGSFEATYKIPNKLKGEYRIAIRLQSPTSGYFAYNWFYNNTTGGTKPPGGGTGGMKPGTIPTFSIQAVVRNNTVTISTLNFPANDSFVVTMGPMGTRGIGGYVVKTQPSGDGGAFQATYDIPAQLANSYQIAIRLQSKSSGYYAYNWFYNNTTK